MHLLQDLKIDSSWTLFLDRDGVINQKLENDYVKIPEEFILLPRVKEAIDKLSRIFSRIILITNQQGIGKRLMSELDLTIIHNKMQEGLDNKITAIYFCPHLASEDCNCRKPKTGMILKAQKDFPEIAYNKSIIVGDSKSDIELGKKAGIQTILITSNHKISNANFTFGSLYEFSMTL